MAMVATQATTNDLKLNIGEAPSLSVPYARCRDKMAACERLAFAAQLLL